MTRMIVLAGLVACAQQPSKLDAVVASTPAPKPPEAPRTFDAAAIDAWAGAQLAKRGVVGAALVVVKDGETVLAKGYGKQRSDRAGVVDAETPFAIGSVSKQLACAAVYLLADRGQLALTDPVSKYYPEITGDITLADLGGHTAGLRDFYPLDYVDARMTKPIEPDALIAEYAKQRDFAPGARFSYSNTGYTILARVVEKVAGKPYGQFLQDELFAPLGMTASITPPAAAASGHVALLAEAPSPGPFEANGWLFGAADVWTSANGLTAWNVAFAEGRVLSAEARRALATPRTVADGRPTGYSCGFGVRTVNGEYVLSHTGWVGGFHSYSAIVPRTRSSVVLLTNDQRHSATGIHDTIVRLVTLDESAVPAIPGPAPEEAARALIVQLQQGTFDRALVGEDLAGYWSDARLAAASTQLRGLGEPKVKLVSRRERGGMEATSLSVAFDDRSFSVSMFRSPDGKIRQLLFDD